MSQILKSQKWHIHRTDNMAYSISSILRSNGFSPWYSGKNYAYYAQILKLFHLSLLVILQIPRTLLLGFTTEALFKCIPSNILKYLFSKSGKIIIFILRLQTKILICTIYIYNAQNIIYLNLYLLMQELDYFRINSIACFV